MLLWKKYKSFAASSTGLIATGILITVTAFLSWRRYVAPKIELHRRRTNEQFAQYIFEERQKKIADNRQQ